MTALAQIQRLSVVDAERETAKGLASWAARRTWSRTDTGRWLNERSPAVLAWLRRRAGSWPDHSKQVGYWMKEFSPKLFARAHARLAGGADDAGREAMLPGEVLR